MNMNSRQQNVNANAGNEERKRGFWNRNKEEKKVEFMQMSKKAETKKKIIIKDELFEMIDKVKSKKTIRTWIIGVCILFVLYWVVSPVITVVQLRYQVTTLKDQLKEIQIENKVLEEELNKVNTHAFIEEVARKELGMVKGTENPIYISETKAPKKEMETRLESNDKIGIYMKDWYEEMSRWFEKGKPER